MNYTTYDFDKTITTRTLDRDFYEYTVNKGLNSGTMMVATARYKRNLNKQLNFFWELLEDTTEVYMEAK